MSQQYKEITPQEADALTAVGADVRYRFNSWDKVGPYSSQSYKYLVDRVMPFEGRYKTPSQFWLIYSTTAWAGTGTPTFLVEVE